MVFARTFVEHEASGSIDWTIDNVSTQPLFLANGLMQMSPEPLCVGQRWHVELQTYEPSAGRRALEIAVAPSVAVRSEISVRVEGAPGRPGLRRSSRLAAAPSRGGCSARLYLDRGWEDELLHAPDALRLVISIRVFGLPTTAFGAADGGATLDEAAPLSITAKRGDGSPRENQPLPRAAAHHHHQHADHAHSPHPPHYHHRRQHVHPPHHHNPHHAPHHSHSLRDDRGAPQRSHSPCDRRDLDVARALEGSRARREATHADARLRDLETAQLLRVVEAGCRAELSRARTTATTATAGGAFARGGGSGWSHSWGGGGAPPDAAAGCVVAARAPYDLYDAACAAALRPLAPPPDYLGETKLYLAARRERFARC